MGNELWFSRHGVSVLQRKNFGNLMHNYVNILNATEVYTPKWLMWQNFCDMFFFTTISFSYISL